ncbi:MAG: type I 3-dehydroquinate dehydratase [Leptospirales bacterium]|nr:type I 3-dehydroquinate dehydratase [Leptospirales bacterium]
MPPEIRLGPLQLGARPHIAAILERPLSSAELSQLSAAGVSLLELRADSFQGGPHGAAEFTARLDPLLRQSFGLLATIREGDAWHGSQRLAAFHSLAPLVDAIDVEFESLQRDELAALAHDQRKLLLLSTHDFQSAPTDAQLDLTLLEADRLQAAIVKIAVRARNIEELERLLNYCGKHKERGLVMIAMGEAGLLSRVAAPFFGSLISYGYLDHPNAPGQLSVRELHELFLKFSPAYRSAYA